MRRLIPCVVVALLFTIVGPRLVGPQNHDASAPFVYEPPEGFVASTDKSLDLSDGAKVWVLEDKKNFDGSFDRSVAATRVILNHSNTKMSVEESDLAKLATEMPKAFEESCDWIHRRHELRTRGDGARVGLIEGDCDKKLNLGALGVPASKIIHSRKLQLMFPDDTGTSIVTVSYPTEQAARWEPLFEATIGKARGVATRVAPPPPWTYGAWALAGLVLGWLGASLIRKKEPAKVNEESKKEDAA